MIDSLQALETADPLALTEGLGANGLRFDGVKNVFLDADDTLWENNVFFLDTIDWLCTVGRRLGHTDRATICLLNRWEDFNIKRIGYGFGSFEKSFLMTIRILVARSGREDLHGGLYLEARRRIAWLAEHPIVWLDGVLDTIPILRERYKVIVVTKGHQKDQMGKVIRSGRQELFHGVEVVPQKYPDNYRRVIEKYGLRAEETVMVGNSPKSDINNPRRAGLRTIYIPHPKGWFRENEPIEPHNPPTIRLPKFSLLPQVLAP